MKNLLHNLHAVDTKIDEMLSEIRVLDKLPFYRIFSRCESKEVEMAVLRKSLHEYYGAKHSILENLEAEIRREKMKLSGLMRDNSLKKTG